MNPIEPIDTRNNTNQDSLLKTEPNPVISPGTDKKLPASPTPEIPESHLTIYPFPVDAKIRILNIKPQYEPNMALAPGRYQIEVSAPNHKSSTQWVELAVDDTLNMRVSLKKEEEVISVITTGNLTIVPSPAEANIRILNIKPPYEPNMVLDAGHYQIEVSAAGYETLTQWVD